MAQTIATTIAGSRSIARRDRPSGLSSAGAGGRGASSRKNSSDPPRFSTITAR